MTNLEYYKDEINEIIENEARADVNSTIANAFAIFSLKHIDNYPHRPDKFIDWLLEEHKEHKEPIKLKQWEKDLLMVFYNFTNNVKLTLNNAIIITPMLRAGYFQGVPNTSMTIKDILDNCIIVSDFKDSKINTLTEYKAYLTHNYTNKQETVSWSMYYEQSLGS